MLLHFFEGLQQEGSLREQQLSLHDIH